MYEPIKRLGQNFLMDRQVVDRMIDALDLVSDDTVIEIGAGHGILTEELTRRLEGLPTQAGRNLRVYAVEIDSRFASKLNDMFLDNPNLEVVEADILKWLPQFQAKKDYKILGSLPFYVTSPILHAIIKMPQRALVCVLLVQKEVAQKIIGGIGDESYLSVFIQTFYEVKYLGQVQQNKFHPEPEVEGAVIKMIRNRVDWPLDMILGYESFLHKGFSHPRKMLNKAFKPEELSLAVIDPKLRPEDIGVEKWVDFFHKLKGLI